MTHVQSWEDLRGTMVVRVKSECFLSNEQCCSEDPIVETKNREPRPTKLFSRRLGSIPTTMIMKGKIKYFIK